MTELKQKMANMSTKKPNLTIEKALSTVPAEYRGRLLRYYRSLKSAYLEGQFDACGLRAGKLCETLLRFLQHFMTATHIPFSQKIPNFQDECLALEKLPRTSGPESFRVVMPRALCFLYTMRNKRAIGHVSGDLDANEIDASTCVRIADWCLCELIRVTYLLPLEDAQAILDSIAERSFPILWKVLGKIRVLKPGLGYNSQVLLLLYSNPDFGLAIEDLFEWTEYSRFSDFKNKVIVPLHKQRLVEYDRETDFVIISPTGMKKVEDDLLQGLITKTNS